MEKTIDMVMEELKETIANAVNESNIPPYLATVVLNELTTECKTLADIQLKQNREKYSKSLAEKEKEEK